MKLFEKLKQGLKKTRSGITERIDRVLAGFTKLDEDLFEELEEILITSDMGVDTTEKVISEIRQKAKQDPGMDGARLRGLLRQTLLDIMKEGDPELHLDTAPSAILVVGVNGVGKTTTIGKMAHMLKEEGKKVLLAAGDTFRAAAIDQLAIWAERTGIDIIRHSENSDPAAVLFDAVQAAKARKADVLICDTAGRLHTKKNLMEELKKMYRVLERELPGGSKEVLLVLDAVTGQNALSQARMFSEAVPLTGIVLTKLDGTAKGGMVVAIKSNLGIPVKLVGVGEKIDDLQRFDPEEFISALFD